MPAAACTNPVALDLSKDNGRVSFRVELTHDGVSTPPNCDGTVSGVFWNNQSPNTWYGHLAASRLGPAVYRIDPGAVGSVVTRSILHSAGLDNRSDVNDNLDLNRVAPQAGERLLN